MTKGVPAAATAAQAAEDSATTLRLSGTTRLFGTTILLPFGTILLRSATIRL